MTTYVVEMNGWGYGLYSSAGNLLNFVSCCDKNTGVVQVICCMGYNPKNMVDPHFRHSKNLGNPGAREGGLMPRKSRWGGSKKFGHPSGRGGGGSKNVAIPWGCVDFF